MLFNNNELLDYRAINKYKYLLHQQSELNNLDFIITHLPHIKAEDEFLKIEKDEAFILSELQTSIDHFNKRLNPILTAVFDEPSPNWVVNFKKQVETVSKYITDYLDRASENYVNRYHYYLYLLDLTQNLTEELQLFKANFAYFISQSNPEKKIDQPCEVSEVTDPFITKNRDIIPELFNFLDLYSLKSFTSVKKDLYALRKNKLYISNFFKKGYPQEVSILDNEDASLPDPYFKNSNMGYPSLSLGQLNSLFHRVIEGNLNLIKGLLPDYLDPFSIVNVEDQNGNTLLHWASFFKHQHILDFFYTLCSNYLSKYERDRQYYNENLRQLAVICNQSNAMNLLMEVQSIHYLDKRSQKSWLHIAAAYGHAALVAILIDRGANINLADKQMNLPLHLAVKHGHLEVVKILLNNFCNVLSLGQDRYCILEIAVRYGHTNIVRFLLQHFSHVWQNATTKACYSGYSTLLHKSNTTLDCALKIAAVKGYPEIVDLLLQHGSKINNFDSDKSSALSEAVTHHHYAVIELLINKKADVNVSSCGQNLLEQALQQFAKETFSLNDMYLKRNDLAYAQSSFWQPSEEQFHEQLKLVKLWDKTIRLLVKNLIPLADLADIMAVLFDFIVQLDVHDIQARPLLHAAVIKENLKVVEILINFGFAINSKMQNYVRYENTLTPLHCAIQTKNINMVKLLLANGADVHAIAYNDLTKPALYFAVEFKDSVIANLLLENGANQNVLGEQDQIALRNLLDSKIKQTTEEQSEIKEEQPPCKKRLRR